MPLVGKTPVVTLIGACVPYLGTGKGRASEFYMAQTSSPNHTEVLLKLPIGPSTAGGRRP